MDLSIPYYEDKTRISNSNIGWFLNKGPAFLHKMLTEDVEEEKNPVLERGTMIHSYILTPEEFQKTYVVWDKSRPTSAQQEKFCQELANSVEIEPNRALESAYKAAYSTKGKSYASILAESSKIASTLKDYIDFLKSGDQRIMISPYDAKMLEKVRLNIGAHKAAYAIVWPGNKGWKDSYSIGANFDTAKKTFYHEFHINWEHIVDADGFKKDFNGVHCVQCKSLLDGLTLDFKNKKAIIYDLKTTQKLWHFEDSIDQYDYLRQLMYYTMAVEWYLDEEYKENGLGWTFEYYIIGIDTTGSNEIRVFKIDEYMVESRGPVIENALSSIAWHQMNNKWDHSREYYEGDGSETLNI